MNDKIDPANPAALKAALEGDMENARIASTPGGIEAQEAQGQRALVSSFDRLPRRFTDDDTFPRETLERLGFAIGDEIDDLFVVVTPPPGWHLKPTDHSMHSYLCDAEGRQRGHVFYKAAFYDRRAHGRLFTRYYVDTQYRDEDDGKSGDPETRRVALDRATGLLQQATPWISARDYKADREQDAAMKRVLTERFPDWENVEAYWERQEAKTG